MMKIRPGTPPAILTTLLKPSKTSTRNTPGKQQPKTKMIRDDSPQDYTSSEEMIVWNHDLTLPLPFLDIPHENLHWTFYCEDQYTPHQEQKYQKNPYKPPRENRYPMDHCYCGEMPLPKLNEVLRTQCLNLGKACQHWQQGRHICHHCGFLINLIEYSLRCSNPDWIPISPYDNDI
jgi:hypothetical protein